MGIDYRAQEFMIPMAQEYTRKETDREEYLCARPGKDQDGQLAAETLTHRGSSMQNLRCQYCMPEEGFPALDPSKIFSFEQILAVAKGAVSIGIFKYRLTGGEPLVRPNVPDLVGRMNEIEGMKIIAMTTNRFCWPPCQETQRQWSAIC